MEQQIVDPTTGHGKGSRRRNTKNKTIEEPPPAPIPPYTRVDDTFEMSHI